MQNIIFYSYLDVWRLIFLFFRPKANCRIFYFNISRAAQFIIRISGLKEKIMPLEFSLAEMRDEKGENLGVKIESYQIEPCDIITDNIIRKSRFICAFGNMFDLEKVIFYFRRIVSEDIKENFAYMNVIKWYCEQVAKTRFDQIKFYVEKSEFFIGLGDFTKRRFNIDLVYYISIKKIFKYFGHFFKSFIRLFVKLNLVIINYIRLYYKHKSTQKRAKRPLLGISHSGNRITFDFSKRCEFPWLLFSYLPYRQVLVYVRRTDIPVTDDEISLLKERQINFLTLRRGDFIAHDVPLFMQTFKGFKLLLLYTLKLIFLCMKEVFKRRFSFLDYFVHADSFIVNYCNAYDLYATYNIKINIDREDHIPTRVAERLALQALGGISISYQLSHWPIPSIIYGSCADVMFLFGPYYIPRFNESGACSKYIVSSGYINDYAFQAVKKQSELLRNRLMKNGAKFIICYFDENSSDDRMSTFPTNKRSAYIYRELIKWALSDGSIGLIFSPKNPTTLLNRMPELEDIIEKAKSSGRCIFMESKYKAISYPAEPVQASDIVITLLVGGTVAMESYLSGVRTVYLDLEGLYYFPEYKRSKDTIVFDNIDKLIDTINSYRNGGKQFNDFEDKYKMPFIDQRDPFRDGRAAERITQYLSWLLEKISAGFSKSETIKYANQKYAENWGREKVVRLSNKGKIIT